MATEHQNPASIRPRDRADLLRLLHGELAPAAAERLRGRLAREPELAAALRRMEGTWDLLDAPPAAPAPPGFAARVAARAAAEGRYGAGEARAPFRPAWARAMAAAALTAGVVAGAAVGWLVIPEQPLAAVQGVRPPRPRRAPILPDSSPDGRRPRRARHAATGTEQAAGAGAGRAGAAASEAAPTA